jgi:GNAT superfamily N-acetyltransferase
VDPLATIRSVLAADLACDERDLMTEGFRVVIAEERAGRRAFPQGPKVLTIATMGTGTVVSCDASRLDWARTALGGLTCDQIFASETVAALSARIARDGQVLAGPDLKFACIEEELRATPALPTSVELEVLEGRAVADLYRHPGFRHALSYRTEGPRPDIVAAIARAEGEVVGIAGASADCEAMWQIGVDVVDGQRRRGIGRAIVSRVTAEVLARGRFPHYSTLVSSLSSSRLALSVAYRLAWVELYARTTY